jgi:hypothetical protein
MMSRFYTLATVVLMCALFITAGGVATDAGVIDTFDKSKITDQQIVTENESNIDNGSGELIIQHNISERSFTISEKDQRKIGNQGQVHAKQKVKVKQETNGGQAVNVEQQSHISQKSNSGADEIEEVVESNEADIEEEAEELEDKAEEEELDTDN